MKKKWQEVHKCNFAIKVSFKENDVLFVLYDRNDKKLFTAKSDYPCTDEKFNACVGACEGYANGCCNNNDEWIYVHNPYWMQCANIIVG